MLESPGNVQAIYIMQPPTAARAQHIDSFSNIMAYDPWQLLMIAYYNPRPQHPALAASTLPANPCAQKAANPRAHRERLPAAAQFKVRHHRRLNGRPERVAARSLAGRHHIRGQQVRGGAQVWRLHHCHAADPQVAPRDGERTGRLRRVLRSQDGRRHLRRKFDKLGFESYMSGLEEPLLPLFRAPYMQDTFLKLAYAGHYMTTAVNGRSPAYEENKVGLYDG